MQLLGIQLRILPVISSGIDWQSAVMPTLTLAIAMSAKYLRQVRSTVLEELNKDYVLGAKARGVSYKVILWKNVLKASMLTIMTLLALSIGSLFGRYSHYRKYFHVGWCRQAGRRCHQYA